MPRRFLRRFFGVWLLCQCLIVAGPAIALWTSMVLECECAHGDGAACPMHHRSPSSTGCALYSTARDNGAILLSLNESIGPTPLATVTHMPSVSTPLELDTHLVIDRPFVPNPRPPRA